MGVNKPSLYATFGCKEEIFREAVELYDRVEGKATSQSLKKAGTAREAVESMLRSNARAYVVEEGPRGCMIVLSSLLGAPENESVRAFLADNRLQGEATLRERLAQGIAEGDLAASADLDQLAAFYTTVLEGSPSRPATARPSRSSISSSTPPCSPGPRVSGKPGPRAGRPSRRRSGARWAAGAAGWGRRRSRRRPRRWAS